MCVITPQNKGKNMKLPNEIENKIAKLINEINLKNISAKRQQLTSNYKTNSGQSKSLIDSKESGVLYSAVRMPATYAVLKTLVSDLKSEDYFDDVNSVIDVGSGTGAGYFAIKEELPNVSIKLIERDNNMIYALEKLIDNAVEIEKHNILSVDTSQNKADLIMSSYCLSEMTDVDRGLAFKKMLEMTDKYLLLVDTGTPKVYEDYLKLAEIAKGCGAKVVAPCKAEKCPLKNDYCQFYARVERSKQLMAAKSGTLPYEDEKYFYLFIKKESVDGGLTNNDERVIRRPVYKPNLVELTLCTSQGVIKKQFTKRDGELYKRVKKSKINEII